MKIAIPVLLSKDSYTSVDAGSCVNDDCFDLPTLVNSKIQSEKKSHLGDFASSSAKTAVVHEKLIT